MAKDAILIDASGRTVAANIRRLRKMRGLTLEALALRMNQHLRPMSKATLSQIENGYRRVDVDDLMVFAKVLHVDPGAILLPPQFPDGKGFALLTGFGWVPFGELRAWMRGDQPIDPPEVSPATINAAAWATWAVTDLQRASIAGDEGSEIPNRKR